MRGVDANCGNDFMTKLVANSAQQKGGLGLEISAIIFAALLVLAWGSPASAATDATQLTPGARQLAAALTSTVTQFTGMRQDVANAWEGFKSALYPTPLPVRVGSTASAASRIINFFSPSARPAPVVAATTPTPTRAAVTTPTPRPLARNVATTSAPQFPLVQDFVDEITFDERLNALEKMLLSRITAGTAAVSSAVPQNIQDQLNALQQQVSLTNRINTLSGVTISSPTFTNTITGLTTDYVTDDGNLYYSDSRARTSLSSTPPITYNSSTGVIGFDFSTANSWTGLQQFQGGASSTNLSVFGSTWIGSTSGTAATTTLQGNTTGTSTIQGFLNVLGTNSTSTFSGALAASYLNLTGANATSTAASGFDLLSGCFSINGTCVGGGGASVTGGTTGMLTAWTDATTLTATSGPTAAFFFATSTTASQFPYASSTALTVSGTTYVGGNITPLTDNTSFLGTSTARFAVGNFGPSGINVWNVGGFSNYEQGSLAFASNVFKLSTAAPLGGNYRDIQIAPGNSSGLYLNSSGQAGLGYTSFSNTSIGTALLIDGRVGIGTTTPGGPLVILANGRATGDLRYGLQLVKTDTANTQATGIVFAGQGGTSRNIWVQGTDAAHNNSNNFYTATSSGPAAIPRFLIDTNGNVGINGTTTPAGTLGIAGNLFVANYGMASSPFTGNVE